MTPTQSITTNKFAMDFGQQKRDLNAEQKKTAALEQCLKEMESALTARKIPTPPHTKHSALSQTKTFPPQLASPLLHRNLIPS